MTRIVAGEWGGRRLRTPPGDRTRPTSDRVREGLFNTLGTLTDLTGARFLDLYAGSGAVGLEARSRGAEHVLLVESDPRASRTVRANLAALAAAPTVILVSAPVRAALAAGPGEGGGYDVVFADPPYALDDPELVAVQEALVAGDWLVPGGLLVWERSVRSGPPPWVGSVTELRTRRYGETALWYGRRS